MGKIVYVDILPSNPSDETNGAPALRRLTAFGSTKVPISVKNKEKMLGHHPGQIFVPSTDRKIVPENEVRSFLYAVGDICWPYTALSIPHKGQILEIRVTNKCRGGMPEVPWIGDDELPGVTEQVLERMDDCSESQVVEVEIGPS